MGFLKRFACGGVGCLINVMWECMCIASMLKFLLKMLYGVHVDRLETQVTGFFNL